MKDELVFWSMQPTLGFTMPGLLQEPVSLRIGVTSEREFDFTELEGWLWHKTWIIPTIVVTIELQNSHQTGFQFPKGTYLNIMAVKPGSRDPDRFFLIDVGLQGTDSL